MKRTRGSETSQYPEEKKANATPSVAASEIGPGQTEKGNFLGVVGPRYSESFDNRIGWNV